MALFRKNKKIEATSPTVDIATLKKQDNNEIEVDSVSDAAMKLQEISNITPLLDAKKRLHHEPLKIENIITASDDDTVAVAPRVATIENRTDEEKVTASEQFPEENHYQTKLQDISSRLQELYQSTPNRNIVAKYLQELEPKGNDNAIRRQERIAKSQAIANAISLIGKGFAAWEGVKPSSIDDRPIFKSLAERERLLRDYEGRNEAYKRMLLSDQLQQIAAKKAARDAAIAGLIEERKQLQNDNRYQTEREDKYNLKGAEYRLAKEKMQYDNEKIEKELNARMQINRENNTRAYSIANLRNRLTGGRTSATTRNQRGLVIYDETDDSYKELVPEAERELRYLAEKSVLNKYGTLDSSTIDKNSLEIEIDNEMREIFMKNKNNPAFNGYYKKVSPPYYDRSTPTKSVTQNAPSRLIPQPASSREMEFITNIQNIDGTK